MQRAGCLLRQAAFGFQTVVERGLSLQGSALRGIAQSSSCLSEPVKGDDKAPVGEFDHATGLEKAEIDNLKEGKDIFHEDWITAEFPGTPEEPVVVESAFDERVVGVPDPDDDCLVVWDVIRSGDPPKQIVPDGEYFVLKKSEPPTWTGIPESFKGGAAH